MDETILFPSPNWFQVSGLAVSNDGWLAYGGPSKSLCVLKPLPTDAGVVEGTPQYTAHVLNRAHPDKIVSVDLCLDWPVKRQLLVGTASGSVKQWCLEEEDKGVQFVSTLSHEVHSHEKEEIIGVAYSDETYAVTLGGYGNIVKWDLNSNVVKTYSNLLKTFKPSCMACSHHVALNVAIGTKQGVLFLLDLNGAGTILYKVRCQDDEIMNVSWCPEYDVQVEKSLEESKRAGVAPQSSDKPKAKKSTIADRMEKIRQQRDPEAKNTSAVKKDLPEDSFEDSVVQEDDMFDIYKDHEADEFGHKKYQPEDILVKIKEPKKDDDYLAECLKLKEAIIKKKNEPEPTIESLVDALDKTDISSDNGPEVPSKEGSKEDSESSTLQTEVPSGSKDVQEDANSVSSVHMHKHLLATIGKQGGVRIWSKTGKLVASCALTSGKHPQGRYRPTWATLTWCKPDLLLIADGKNQLLECNPLKIDCKNKLESKLIHSLHKRGLHCVASNAARAPAPSRPVAWTVAQDRSLGCYNLVDRTTVLYNTCGGFVYNIQACPYDASKVAISVGDGAVRVWSADESDTEGRLKAGRVHTYWQHVQGKVLTVAWHPTKENLLAFGTAESRVGLIEATASEKPARALAGALAGGVYALCWGSKLYAAARGDLVAYTVEQPDEPATPVQVKLEGALWSVSAVRARDGLLAVGSDAGGVAVLDEATYSVLAAAFVYSKMIHTVEWHPVQTSFSAEESPYKNLIAACSQDKTNTITILEFGDKEDGRSLHVWKTLSGHSGPVLQVAWSPHHERSLLSTSHDGTVRVWDVVEGTCTSIFGGHGSTTLGAAWSPRPSLANVVMSGGTDCCLRMWDAREYPANAYTETKEEPPKKDKKKKKTIKAKESQANEVEEDATSEDTVVATTQNVKIVKISKKFLLPIITKQMAKPKTTAVRRMLHKYMVKKQIMEAVEETEDFDLDYIKIFGTNKEVNEIFDMEMEKHLEAGNTESWIVLAVFRGHIDDMIKYAAEKNILCPYLLSIAPGVSSKYWKDTSKLYLAQIDRLVASGEEDKLVASRHYGGPVFRKVMSMLSLQDVLSAVKTLVEAKLYKEAYVLCRIRYMDEIGDTVLENWAKHCLHSGMFDAAALCHIALGNLLEAATVLSRSPDQDNLSLAAELAKAAGQTILADNLTGRSQLLAGFDMTSDIDTLPSRIELLLRGNGRDETCNVNGEHVNGN